MRKLAKIKHTLASCINNGKMKGPNSFYFGQILQYYKPAPASMKNIGVMVLRFMDFQ